MGGNRLWDIRSHIPELREENRAIHDPGSHSGSRVFKVVRGKAVKTYYLQAAVPQYDCTYSTMLRPLSMPDAHPPTCHHTTLPLHSSVPCVPISRGRRGRDRLDGHRATLARWGPRSLQAHMACSKVGVGLCGLEPWHPAVTTPVDRLDSGLDQWQS